MRIKLLLIDKTARSDSDNSSSTTQTMVAILKKRLDSLTRKIKYQADQDEWYRISRLLLAVTNRQQLAQVVSKLSALEQKIEKQS